MTLPFGGQPAGEHAAPARRTVLVVVGALVLVVVLGGAYLLTSGGSGSQTPAAVVASSRTVTPRATPSPSADGGAAPVADVLPPGHNPFGVLYTAPASAAPGGAAAVTGSTGSPMTVGSSAGSGSGGTTAYPPAPLPSTPAPSTPPPSTPPPSTPPPTTPPPTTPPPTWKAYPLKLVGVGGSSADGYQEGWQVSGVGSVTLVGQRFGRHGELVVVALSPQAGQPLGVMLKVGGDAPIFVAIGDTIQVR